MKKVLLEALAVAITGAFFAFLANAVSPRGLSLTRNYAPAPPPTNPAGQATNSLAERLHAEGLQLADSNQVSKLFRDPGYQQGSILFIDARDPQHYADGHIPGAHLLDYYHPEKYLVEILPLCAAAQQIVVYCNGGDCEDSQFAALLLRDAQVPAAKLFVYAGGITEWTNSALPVEIGDRNSGTVRPSPTP